MDILPFAEEDNLLVAAEDILFLLRTVGQGVHHSPRLDSPVGEADRTLVLEAGRIQVVDTVAARSP